MRNTREHNPTQERLMELLFGRRIVRVNIDSGTATLDDGTVLRLGGNEGCGGCSSGWYDLTILNTIDNAITNVELTDEWDGRYGEDGTYRVFVVAEDQTQHLVAQFDGSDGNGYYGSGYWLEVVSRDDR